MKAKGNVVDLQWIMVVSEWVGSRLCWLPVQDNLSKLQFTIKVCFKANAAAAGVSSKRIGRLERERKKNNSNFGNVAVLRVVAAANTGRS